LDEFLSYFLIAVAYIVLVLSLQYILDKVIEILVGVVL